MNRSRAQQFMLMGAAAVLLAGVAFSANTALADKGGNGGPHNRGGQTAGAGACVISPDPLAYGAYGALDGTGFTTYRRTKREEAQLLPLFTSIRVRTLLTN